MIDVLRTMDKRAAMSDEGEVVSKIESRQQLEKGKVAGIHARNDGNRICFIRPYTTTALSYIVLPAQHKQSQTPKTHPLPHARTGDGLSTSPSVLL